MIRGIRIAMLTTSDDQGNLHSRPMATQYTDFDGELWFFTDDTAPKSQEIQKSDRVNLAYIKPDEHRFVSIAGRAELVHDKAKMKELWSPLYKTWFPKGMDTPHISLMLVKVEHTAILGYRKLQQMVYLMGFAKAFTTGAQPERKAGLDRITRTRLRFAENARCLFDRQQY